MIVKRDKHRRVGEKLGKGRRKGCGGLLIVGGESEQLIVVI